MTTNPLRAARGTTATLATRVLLDGELAYNTTTERLVVGDGVTTGGVEYVPENAEGAVEARLDALEVADGALDGRLDTAETSITTLTSADTALDGRLDALEATLVNQASPISSAMATVLSQSTLALGRSEFGLGEEDSPTFTGLNVTTAAAGTAVTLTSTEAGTNSGPNIVLDRNSASPAANDTLARLIFRGRSSTGVARDYADFLPLIADATNASEDATMFHRVMVNGVNTSVLAVTAGLIYPPTNDGTALGNGLFAFSDLALASGAVVNFGNGDATLTHSSGRIASNVPVGLASYTVAGLPAGSTGDIAYASNGRKNGEGGGSGTGVLVFKDGSAWRACDTGATAAA